jgi:hypothetical protein
MVVGGAHRRHKLTPNLYKPAARWGPYTTEPGVLVNQVCRRALRASCGGDDSALGPADVPLDEVEELLLPIGKASLGLAADSKEVGYPKSRIPAAATNALKCGSRVMRGTS